MMDRRPSRNVGVGCKGDAIDGRMVVDVPRLIEIGASPEDHPQSYHDLLEENQKLKEEVARLEMKKEDRLASEDKVDELEQSLVEMKLELATFRSKEDHYKLSVGKLEAELKMAQEENEKLKQSILPGGTLRRNSDPTKKMAPLRRSWFSDSLTFLDRSFRREDSTKSDGTFLDKCRREELPTNPPANVHSSELTKPPVVGMSFVDAKKASIPSIGSDVVLPCHHDQKSQAACEPRLTMISNITDCTYDGDD